MKFRQKEQASGRHFYKPLTGIVQVNNSHKPLVSIQDPYRLPMVRSCHATRGLGH